jgi:threonine/homoserine/homoserine lactone efflux protein
LNKSSLIYIVSAQPAVKTHGNWQLSELAFNVLKYCGAGYLVWLGLNMLLRPRNSLTPVETAA